MVGTVVSEGIQVKDNLIIPDELISGSLMRFTKSGDKVKLIRNHGGQEFYIVEIYGFNPVLSGTTVKIAPIIIGDITIEELKIKEVSR
jgi:hypothetical protein